MGKERKKEKKKKSHFDLIWRTNQLFGQIGLILPLFIHSSYRHLVITLRDSGCQANHSIYRQISLYLRCISAETRFSPESVICVCSSGSVFAFCYFRHSLSSFYLRSYVFYISFPFLHQLAFLFHALYWCRLLSHTLDSI